MTIFSRRAIQRSLDDLNGVLSPQDLKKLVNRLNLPGAGRLATAWEVCLLRSFSSIGHISYETKSADGRRPDIAFRYRDENQIGFIADITTVSDAGLHDANPFMEFSQSLHHLAKAFGLEPNWFYIDVRGERTGPYRFEKTKLLLPKRNAIPDFLERQIRPFLIEIQKENLLSRTVNINDEEGISLTVSYNPGQRFAGGHYPSYESTYAIKGNPLWNRLKEKATQLKVTSESSKVGIIVCDGGCHLLQARYRGHSTFTPEDVIREFCAETPFISFVIFLTVDVTETQLHNKDYKLRADMYAKPELGDLYETLRQVLEMLPSPTMGAIDAYHRSREDRYDLGHHGGARMSRSKVTISSRELQELLAGQISHQEFLRSHRWGEAGHLQERCFWRCVKAA
jgi:hypothetical protein